MFVRYFVEIPLPLERIESALGDEPERWIPTLADTAEARAEQLLADLGYGPGDGRVGNHVEVRLGPVLTSSYRTVLPMSWTPTTPGSAFPELEGDLEVAGLGPGRTQMSMSVRYAPPERTGGQIETTLLHRVAEATVKDFLDRVEARLVTLVH
jgi:hypothetical protein